MSSSPQIRDPGDSAESVGAIYLYLIVLVAAVGGFLFGYDLSLISGAVIFLRQEWNLTPFLFGAVTGSAILGCPFGPLAGVWLADMLGRKRTLILSSFLFLMSTIGSALAGGPLLFSLWRFVGGMGVGLASTVSPMYIAEVAPARLRGRLVVVNQLAIVIGLSLSVFVTYLLSFGGHWRWMFATQGVPVFCLMAGLVFVPESPRWLAAVGRFPEALGVWQKSTGGPRPSGNWGKSGRNWARKGGLPRADPSGSAAGVGHRHRLDGLFADQRRQHDPVVHADAVHGGRDHRRPGRDSQQRLYRRLDHALHGDCLLADTGLQPPFDPDLRHPRHGRRAPADVPELYAQAADRLHAWRPCSCPRGPSP